MRGIALRGVVAIAGVLACAGALAQEPGTVRNVTPPGMTPGPAGEGPLVREPTPPRPPAEARWRRYFLPVTTDSATFSVNDGKLVIRIAGVAAPAVDETCTFSDGSAWPCGRTALHQFRMFLRGRAIECYFPPDDAVQEVTAPCRIGETDLGLWLLTQGWARGNELSTDAYLAAVAEARCTGIGIWRGAKRPDYCPSVSGEGVAAAPVEPPQMEPAEVAPDVGGATEATGSVPPSADAPRARFTDDLFEE
jgi:endonuclease YncB( thermonuclease family)